MGQADDPVLTTVILSLGFQEAWCPWPAMMDFKITTTNAESSPVVDNNKRLKESWAEDQFPEAFDWPSKSSFNNLPTQTKTWLGDRLSF